MAIRLFTDLALEAGATVVPDPKQAHYLGAVMRRRSGDQVLLFNGRDGEWAAILQVEGRRQVRLELARETRAQAPEPGPVLHFAPLKRPRQELLLEKATELGVAVLAPVIMRRSVVERVNAERQRAILIEAAEQCGRLSVPDLREPEPLATLRERPRQVPLLWADEASAGGEAAPVPFLLEALLEAPDADLLIGPEGGFDPDERDLLEADPKVVRVGLGPLILRAETAALAALATWQAVRLRRSRS